MVENKPKQAWSVGGIVKLMLRCTFGGIALLFVIVFAMPPIMSHSYDVPRAPDVFALMLSLAPGALLAACIPVSLACRAAIALAAALGVVGLQLLWMRLYWPQVPANWTAIGLEAVLVCAVCCALVAELRRRARGRYEPVCPCEGCGYELIGNTSGRCPECGRAIDHDVPACGSRSDGGEVTLPARHRNKAGEWTHDE